MILGVAGLLALAIGVFASLSHARQAREQGQPRRYAELATLTPLTLVQAEAPPVPTGEALPVFPAGAATSSGAPPSYVMPSQSGPDPYLTAPAMVVDLGDGNPGAQNGAASDELRLAIRDYQRDHGITATGVVDAATADQLKVTTR